MKIFLSCFLLLVFLGMGSLQAQDEEVLVGMVEGAKWDNDGNAIAAVLVITSEEEDDQGKVTTYTEEYNIKDDVKGKMLFKLVGKTVEVNAFFLEDEEGNIYLKITSFKEVKSEEEELEEPEEEPIK